MADIDGIETRIAPCIACLKQRDADDLAADSMQCRACLSRCTEVGGCLFWHLPDGKEAAND